MKFSTKAIHVGQEPDPVTGAVITPIYQTTTFVQETPGVHKGYEYSRSDNPTRTVLQEVLAGLEGGKHAYTFSSGLGAMTTLCMALFEPGDHILVGDDVYGGTYRFLTKVFKKFGVEIDFIDMTDLDLVRDSVKDNTRMFFLETPTNPLLKLIDLEAVIGIAKERGVQSCVDNTFATPYLQLPLELGADIVLHSTTKYIGGHSDVVGGALVVNDAKLADTLKFHQNSLGATPDPFASWLTLRGTKTLGLRMQAHCNNALALAEYLESHPQVDSVIYPGLASHPQHELAKRQMPNGFGGMISMRVAGGADETAQFLKHLRLFALAESLGGIESLVEIPAIMTHASIDPEVRNALGITDNLVRLSCGIEDLEDLQADLDGALQAASKAKVA